MMSQSLKIYVFFAPQAQFQSVGLGTKAPDDVRVECVSVLGYGLFDELDLGTATQDFFKI